MTLARGGVQMPPILSMHLPELNAELDVKTAYVPGLGRGHDPAGVFRQSGTRPALDLGADGGAVQPDRAGPGGG